MPSKRSRVQFYADECFPIPTVSYLRSLGCSIIHAFDKNYIQKSDRFHLLISKKLKRVLITLDRDFIYYEDAILRNCPGVVVLSVGSNTPLNVNKVSRKLIQNITKDLVKESLIKITIDKLIKIKDRKLILSKKI